MGWLDWVNPVYGMNKLIAGGAKNALSPAQGGDPYAGMPGAPDYNPAYDPSTMAMGPELQSQLNGINVNTQGIDKFRDEALRTGPSVWAGLARRNLAAQAADARGAGMQQVAGAGAQARSSLASHGGLTSGAAERVAKSGQRDLMSMNQGVNHDVMANDLQIGQNDETNRIQQLGMLPGMENTALQPAFQKTALWGQGKQFDVGNALKEAQNKNQFAMDRYHEQMAAWGANRQAQATENSGKK
jgi:hypothetical protein